MAPNRALKLAGLTDARIRYLGAPLVIYRRHGGNVRRQLQSALRSAAVLGVSPARTAEAAVLEVRLPGVRAAADGRYRFLLALSFLLY